MDQWMNRQPAFLLKNHHYVEIELPDYPKSFCYELILSEKIMMIPNNCMDYIWNIDRKELYCFEDIIKSMELTSVGDRLFGIHLDSLYICKCEKENLELWMEKLGQMSDFGERVGCCLKQMQEILQIERVHPFVRHAVEQMEEAKGRVTVEMIASDLDYTPRHMERLFLQTYSYGPKRFCRYIRLMNAVSNMVRFPEQNISRHIENLGYADQSHFQREFKMYMGMTPKQFIRQIYAGGEN